MSAFCVCIEHAQQNLATGFRELTGEDEALVENVTEIQNASSLQQRTEDHGQQNPLFKNVSDQRAAQCSSTAIGIHITIFSIRLTMVLR